MMLASLDDGRRTSPFLHLQGGVGGKGLVLSSTGEGRRLDGGLRSVAEVAASIFQSEKWEGMGLQKRPDKSPALRS